MSTLVSETPEVEEHYITQAAITAALIQSMREAWPEVISPATLNDYREVIAALVSEFQTASIATAYDHYDDMRTSAGIVEPHRPSVIAEWSPARVNAYIESATEDRLREMREAALMAERTALAEQLRLDSEGVAQQLVADAGRDQIVAAVEGDELALGFVRIAQSDACAFCLVQAIRKTRAKPGKPERYGVYKSRETAGQIPPDEKGKINRFHPNCNCTVEPVFAGDYQLEPGLREIEALYANATVGSKPRESLKDFRRALAASRRGDTPADQPEVPTSDQPSQAAQFGSLLDGLNAALRRP